MTTSFHPRPPAGHRRGRPVRACALAALTALALVACGGGSGSSAETGLPASTRLTADATYGAQGQTLLPLGSIDGNVTAARLQADGKLLVAGWRQTALPDPTHFGWMAREALVWRLNADGSLDASFGQNGEAALNFKGSDTLTDMVLQSDGSIVLAVSAIQPCLTRLGYPFGFWSCFTESGDLADIGTVVARLTSAGQIDPTFGVNGNVEAPSDIDLQPKLAVQPDQRILLLRSTGSLSLGLYSWELRRFSRNGQADAGYGGNGVAESSVSSTCNAKGAGVLATAAGGAVVAANNQPPRYGVCLDVLDAEGQPDDKFNGGQPLLIALPGSVTLAGMAERPNGNLVLAGRSWASSTVMFAHQVDGSGVPVAGYGDAGTALIDPPAGASLGGYASLIGSDGSVVSAGAIWPTAAGTPQEPFWARWTADGQPDANFAASGLYQPGADAVIPQLLQRDSDGRWLVVGVQQAANGQRSAVVWRVRGDAP